MRKLWSDEAWEEYLHWQTQDKFKKYLDYFRVPYEGR